MSTSLNGLKPLVPWIAGLTLVAFILGFINVLITVLAVIAIVFLTVFAMTLVMRQNNRLVTLQNAIHEARANIQVEEQRRRDLLENFRNAVLGSLYYEKDRLNAVLATIRSQSINAVFSLYPELRALAHLVELGTQIRSSEDRIATMRIQYNSQAKAYNESRQTFPTNFLLGRRFPPATYFTAAPQSGPGYNLKIPRV
jgi:LemA protein